MVEYHRGGVAAGGTEGNVSSVATVEAETCGLGCRFGGDVGHRRYGNECALVVGIGHHAYGEDGSRLGDAVAETGVDWIDAVKVDDGHHGIAGAAATVEGAPACGQRTRAVGGTREAEGVVPQWGTMRCADLNAGEHFGGRQATDGGAVAAEMETIVCVLGKVAQHEGVGGGVEDGVAVLHPVVGGLVGRKGEADLIVGRQTCGGGGTLV